MSASNDPFQRPLEAAQDTGVSEHRYAESKAWARLAGEARAGSSHIQEHKFMAQIIADMML
jgi:hypothetical protein